MAFWPDHGHRYFLIFGERNPLFDGARHRVLAIGFSECSRVAGRNDHVLHAQALRELPRESMLATTATND